MVMTSTFSNVSVSRSSGKPSASRLMRWFGERHTLPKCRMRTAPLVTDLCEDEVVLDLAGLSTGRWSYCSTARISSHALYFADRRAIGSCRV